MLRQKLTTASIVLTALTVSASVVHPITAEASTDLNYRKRVVGLAGIMNITSTDAQVTRAEFASMLANATTYKSSVAQLGNTAVFADVPQGSLYAGHIKLAADQGWMTGYLGGSFKPDQYITLQEAVRGVLWLLEYTNEDFEGNQVAGRMTKYHYLELDEAINRDSGEILTKEDCINLFYNLMKTEMKSGKAYATVLDAELNSDGEVNAMGLADYALKGPKIVKKNSQISDYIPFSVHEASFYLNGVSSTYDRVKQSISDNGFVVIYYNAGSKSVWAYSENGDQTDRAIIKGEISHIYYQSSNVMTPSGVEIDDDGVEYQLKDSQVQFGFSIYGSLRVGDEVTLICEVTENSSGDKVYTVVDYIEN